MFCRLANKLRPGVVPKINDPATMPFKKMENIANYLKAVRALGMKEFEMFGTPDLYDEKNVPQVSRSCRAGFHRHESMVACLDTSCVSLMHCTAEPPVHAVSVPQLYDSVPAQLIGTRMGQQYLRPTFQALFPPYLEAIPCRWSHPSLPSGGCCKALCPPPLSPSWVQR